jgi:hypothetical protein
VTFLELVQTLHYESGATGTAPAAVTSQTGQARRLVNWIKQANLDVQNLWMNWKFLRSRDEGRTLTPGTNTLIVPTDFGDGFWDVETIRIVAAGDTTEQHILVAQYEDVKGEILDESEGTPWRVTIMPDNSLRFEGTPDAADEFRGDYYRGPDEDELASNTDESSIPSRYHRVILGRALQLYANYESAPEVKIQGDEIYDTYLARLENSQLPNRDHSRYRTGARIQVVTDGGYGQYGSDWE